MKDESKKWFSFAKDNLLSASVLLESKLFNPCLQNIQQSVEKYLKAFLLAKKQRIRKTHSINELNIMLQDIDVHIGLSDEDCELLDTIYLPSKYPLGGILPDFEPDYDLCRNCLNIAQAVEKKINELSG